MSDNSTPDRDWLDERYPRDVASPEHLDNAIRTGTFCVYAPEHRVDWEL